MLQTCRTDITCKETNTFKSLQQKYYPTNVCILHRMTCLFSSSTHQLVNFLPRVFIYIYIYIHTNMKFIIHYKPHNISCKEQDHIQPRTANIASRCNQTLSELMENTLLVKYYSKPRNAFMDASQQVTLNDNQFWGNLKLVKSILFSQWFTKWNRQQWLTQRGHHTTSRLFLKGRYPQVFLAFRNEVITTKSYLGAYRRFTESYQDLSQLE